MGETPEQLNLDATFYFCCDPGLDCFTQCCQDVNILLTPYDILQIKDRLGISSTEFLEQYTKTLIAPETALPAIQLKMDEENNKRCHFVGERGCGVYEGRPWSCRLYPLDMSDQGEGFAPIVDSSRCLGLNSEEIWELRDWFQDQGLEPYDNWNRRFAELTEDRNLTSWRKKYPQGFEIFHLACYDVDRFRRVVFKEELYRMVDQADIDLEQLQDDDLALLEFAFTWLKRVAKLNVDE
jgi:Fe-S-cluster containining protein